MRNLTRRGFLALSAGGLLVACGGGGSDGSTGSGGSGGKVGALVGYFPPGIHRAGRRERLPFGVADADGVPLSDGPAELSFTVLDEAGKTVHEATVARHAEGLPRAYYPLEVELAAAGIYTARTEASGQPHESMFSINPAGGLGFPGVGESMPPFDTPTVADNRGVNPLCTQPEPCPFHSQTLTEALAGPKPVAYLVGTPAHCQTGICGPVLDLLIAAAKDFPGIDVVHAEVFSDLEGRTVAPAVTALSLDFEPLLFLVGADGVVRNRLDVIYDKAELRDALAALGT